MTLFDASAYHFSWYMVPPLAAAVFLAFLALVVLIRERLSPVSLTFSLLVMSGVIWLTSYAGIFSSREESTAILWIYIENCGVVLIPTFLLLFSLVVVQKLYRYRILIWVGYAVSYFFLVITPSTDWMVAGAYQYPWGYYTKYGPLAKWFFVFFAVMMSAALYVLWDECRNAQSSIRERRFCQLFSACLLVQFSAVDTLAAFGFHVYPFGYLFVLVFILLMAQVIMQYRLTDITPAFAAPEILSTMTEGLLVLDKEGLVRIANPAFCRMTGKPEKKLLGNRVWKETPEILDRERFDNFLQGKGAQGYEVTLKPEGKDEVVLSSSISAIRDTKNFPEAVMLVLRDVTVQRAAQKMLEQSHAELELKVSERTRELEAANVELKKLDERKTKFLALASHELKTPLASIHGFLDFMLQGPQSSASPQQLECLKAMKTSSDRLRRLISDLLDISKIELGHLQMKKTLENIGGILKEEIAILKEEINRKELQLQEAIQENLPSVICDRDWIKEVFDNLISNAVKYTPRGGSIRVCASASKGGILVTVEDSGIGIKPEDYQRIFEPFERLRQSGLEGETSTGLGLSLVKQITEAHGGTVSVTSREGKGSCFSVMFPCGSPDIKKS